MPDGAVIIAAITSCTNTSNPRNVIAAGLLARQQAGPDPQAVGQVVAGAGLEGRAAVPGRRPA
jgi:aconitase A